MDAYEKNHLAVRQYWSGKLEELDFVSGWRLTVELLK